MRGCGSGYGRDWEEGNPYCVDCPDEYTCRDKTLKRRRIRRQQSTQSGGFSSGSGSYSYTTNKNWLLPRPGESPLMRMLKNFFAGAASAVGGELFCFWQEWRLPPDQPFMEVIPYPEEGKKAEQPKPTQANKPKKEKPNGSVRVAKKIQVDDDFDDLDLDDL